MPFLDGVLCMQPIGDDVENTVDPKKHDKRLYFYLRYLLISLIFCSVNFDEVIERFGPIGGCTPALFVRVRFAGSV